MEETTEQGGELIVRDIEKEMKNISKEVQNIRATIVQYANVEDTYTKTIVNGCEKKNE